MEQNDLLPKSNQSLIQKRLKNFKKSLIRTMAGLGASAILLTGTGCDQIIKPDDTIDRETDYTYNDTEPNVTNPVETEPTVTDKVGEVNREPVVIETYDEIVNSGKLEEYQQIFDVQKQKIYDGAYGTQFNPTCYEYFRNLYPEATDDEISKCTRIYFEFVSQGDLYVALSSSAGLQKTGSLIQNVDQYSFLKFEDIGEYAEKLTNSSEDILKHSLLLNELMNNYNYNILAETNMLNNNFNYKKLGFEKNDVIQNLSVFPTSFNGYDEDTNKKYFYFIAPSLIDITKKSLYYAESISDYDIEEDPDLFFKAITFNGSENVVKQEISNIDYYNEHSSEIYSKYENELNK